MATNRELIFYVSPNGNDLWSGALPEPNPECNDGPFATLLHTRDAIRAEKASSGTAISYTVMIRGGTYYLSNPLVLTDQDSGTRDHPITWCAFPGEKPTLSGGCIIDGWEPDTGQVIKAKVPDPRFLHLQNRQLFFHGQRQRRSRWPKFDHTNPIRGGWAYPEAAVPEFGLQAFRYREGALPRKWAKPGEGEVKIAIGHGWMYNILAIRNIDEEKRTLWLARETFDLDLPPWFMRVPLGENSRYIIENIREELTEPGEWCFDSSEGTFYFWPSDDSLSSGETVVPLLDCLIRIRDAQWINISGLTFTQTTTGDDLHRIRLDGYGAMFPQRGWSYCGEALHLRSAGYCTIENCIFDQVGGNAIYLERDNYRNVIRRNEIAFAGANAIVLIGDRSFHPMYNEVTDNHIHHCGVLLNFIAGVFLGVSDGNVISHNSIHDMPHHAINLGSNGFGRNYIEYNDIRSVCLEIADTGAINSWMDVPGPWIDAYAERSGHIIRNNLIIDVPGCVIENGQIIDDRTTRGIYLDDCTSNCYVYGNIIVRAGMGFMVHGGKHNVIENNVVIDCRIGLHGDDWPPRRPGNAHILGMFRGNRFVRNIVLSNLSEAYPYFFWGWHDRQIEQCDENIFYLTGVPNYRVPGIGSTKNVTDSTYQDWQTLGFDKNSVIADPMFINLAKEDFRLSPDSPALNRGFQPIDVSKIGIRPIKGANA